MGVADQQGEWWSPQQGGVIRGSDGRSWILNEFFHLGGQSEIWKVSDQRGGDSHLAKVYNSGLHPAHAHERCEILAGIAALECDHLLRSQDVFVHGNRLVEIMPHYGTTLNSFWDRHDLGVDCTDSKDIILKIIVQIGAALERLHESNLVHCDVSADNILVGGDNQGLRAVLADFGTTVHIDNRTEEEPWDGKTHLELGGPRTKKRLAPAFYWLSNKQPLAPDDFYQIGLTILELYEVSDGKTLSDSARAGYLHREIAKLPDWIQGVALGLLNGNPAERLQYADLLQDGEIPRYHPRMYRSILQPSRHTQVDESRPFSIAEKLAAEPTLWFEHRGAFVQSVRDWLWSWSAALKGVSPPKSIPSIDRDLPKLLGQLQGSDLKTAWKAIWLLDCSIPFELAGTEFYTFEELASFIGRNTSAEDLADLELERAISFSLDHGILQAWIERMLQDPGTDRPAWCSSPHLQPEDFAFALDRCVTAIQADRRPAEDRVKLYWLALRYCLNPEAPPPAFSRYHAETGAVFASYLLQHAVEEDAIRRSGRISVWQDAISWRKEGKESPCGLGSIYATGNVNPALTSSLAVLLGAREGPEREILIEGQADSGPDRVGHGATVIREIHIFNQRAGYLAGVIELKDQKGPAKFELIHSDEKAYAALMSQWEEVESAAGGVRTYPPPEKHLIVPFSGNKSVVQIRIEQGPKTTVPESSVQLQIRSNGEQGIHSKNIHTLRIGTTINFRQILMLGMVGAAAGFTFFAAFAAILVKQQGISAATNASAKRWAEGNGLKADFSPLGPFAEGGETEATFQPMVLTAMLVILLLAFFVWYCCFRGKDSGDDL